MSSAYDDALYTDDALAERLAGDLWRQLWGYTRPYRTWVWGLCACAVVVALMDVAFPLITREVVDAIGESGAQANLTPWFWAYGGATVALAGAVGTFIFLGGRLRTHISHDIRRDAFNQLQDLSFAYFDRRPVGWLMARMTSDCERLSNILAWGLLDLAWGGTVMSGALVAMIIMAPNLTVTVVAIVPLLALASLRFQQKILTTARDVRRYNAQLTANFNETVMGVQTTQAFQRERDNHRRFQGLSDAMYGASVKNLIYGAIYLPVVLTLSSLALGGALALGVRGALAQLEELLEVRHRLLQVLVVLQPLVSLPQLIVRLALLGTVAARGRRAGRPSCRRPGSARRAPPRGSARRSRGSPAPR